MKVIVLVHIPASMVLGFGWELFGQIGSDMPVERVAHMLFDVIVLFQTAYDLRCSVQYWLEFVGDFRWSPMQLVDSCSSRFSTPQDCLQAYVLHEEAATAKTISNVGARCWICSWCCLRAVRSLTASRLKHPDFGRPCLGGCLHRRDGWACSRAGLGVAQWHSKETQSCLDSAWVCWRRTIRWSRWYTRQ